VCDITEVVAIDGPAGAGKSTVARRVAQVLGFRFLDTGAMYRAATWYAVEQQTDLDAPEAAAAVTRAMPLRLEETTQGLRVWVGNTDISDAIRSPEITRQIYRLDQNPMVRARLVELQREFAAVGPTVAEGRDMGTVVFPKAKCKIFLEAALDERARRRVRDLEAQGRPADYEALRKEIEQRDERTRTRAAAPLRCAEGAVLVDTTSMTVDEAVNEIVRLARAGGL